MIHEEICTYEVAKLAKEKGFNEYVEAFYAEDCNMPHTQGPEKWNEHKGRYAAPTQSLLQRWLREEKGIDIEITPEPTKETESKRIYMWATFSDCDGNYYDAHSCDEEYKTYELALEDALKYALEKLV